MSEQKPSDSDKGEWRGGTGIGSGFTGGDHVANNLFLPGLVGAALATGMVRALAQRPLWMLLWLTPFAVFALCTYRTRRRSRRLHLFFLFLTTVAGISAVVASCSYSPE